MRRILILSLMLLFSTLIVSAQEPKSGQLQDHQKEMEKMRQDMEKLQQQELERLKESSPQLYKQRKAELERQAKIQEIIASLQKGKIPLSQAESQLFPLVKEESQEYINNLGPLIERLEKQLEFLKKAKADPRLLIQRRIDELLGKSTPNPADFIY